MLISASTAVVIMEARKEKAVICARLRESRERANVSKEEAAAAACVQIAAVTAWEKGTSLPTILQLRSLLACYGITSHEALFGSAPLELTPQEATELMLVARSLSPQLKLKIDLILAMAARSRTSQEAM